MSHSSLLSNIFYHSTFPGFPLKQNINMYFNPDSLPVSTSGNLTRPPPSLLPFLSLVAPANTFVILRIQMIKVTVLAESSILYFMFSPGSLRSSDVYRRESGRCCTLPFFLTFLSFHLSRFSFYITIKLQLG